MPLTWRPSHPGSQHLDATVPSERGGEWLVAMVIEYDQGWTSWVSIQGHGPQRVDDRFYKSREEAVKVAEAAYAKQLPPRPPKIKKRWRRVPNQPD